MKTTISSAILKESHKKKYFTSSELYQSLKGLGFNRNSVRTDLNRLIAAKKLFKAPIVLDNGGSFISTSENFKTPEALKKLMEVNFGGRERILSLLNYLQMIYPICDVCTASKLLCTKTISIGNTERLLNGLAEMGILKKFGTGEELWGINKTLFHSAGYNFVPIEVNQNFYDLRQALKAEFVKSVNEWLRKLGFTSDGGGKWAVNTILPSAGGVFFDYVSFSFASGISRKTNKLGRQVVGDILVNELCTLKYAESFIARVTACSMAMSSAPVSFILCRAYEKDAFNLLKKSGVMPWTTTNLFGRPMQDSIELFIQTYTSLQKEKKIEPTQIEQTLQGFVQFGEVFNMRSLMFELLMAYYFSRTGWEQIKMQRKVQDEDTKAKFEVDIDALNSNEFLTVECKGILGENSVKVEEIEKHFDKRFVAFKKMMNKIEGNQLKPKAFRCIFATSGEISEDGHKKFPEKIFKKKNVTYEIWDRAKLLENLHKFHDSTLSRIIKQYYKKTVKKTKTV